MAVSPWSNGTNDGALPEPFPLVGRSKMLATLESLIEASPRDVSAALIAGEGGSGKSRVAEEAAARAVRRGWTVAEGRAYPVERGVPFALFSDAFLPILHELEPSALTVMSRGGEAELAYLFPTLADGPGPAIDDAGSEPDEFRTRLFWNFSEFLKSYAKRTPLLVVLEDLQWADTSSLELLHFVVRHAKGRPLFFLCTFDETAPADDGNLQRIQRSLLSLGIAVDHRLEPLTRDDVAELTTRVFSVDADTVREFSAMLFGWTRGNPFFVEETLKALVSTGALECRKGAWIGWDARRFSLPTSIRDVVDNRLRELSESERTVAEMAAVVGTRAAYTLLRAVSGLEDDELLSILESLVDKRILAERADDGEVVYDFRHPVVRETVYREFGMQRTRMLHGAVAQAIEAHRGADAMAHADELAYHFARGDTAHLSGKAVTYLSAAGRRAVERHADREAVEYLEAALERVDRASPDFSGEFDRRLLGDLAGAHLRLGRYERSAELLSRAVAVSPPATAEHAKALRTLGLAAFWCGRRDEALEHLDAALDAARAAGSEIQAIRVRMTRGHCLQELGRGRQAEEELETALSQAGALGETALIARVHRALALLRIWIGPPYKAEAHAVQAIEMSQHVGDLSVEFWARWGLAVMKGMTGDTQSMAAGMKEAADLADRLRSPVLRLWTAEMTLELAYAKGEWATGVALGEQSIAIARSMNQKALLPRLLTVTSLFYIGRGDLERAKLLVDEACEISGMADPLEHVDVHRIVPAFTGLAHYLVAAEEYEGAMEAARKGVEIAEGTGYWPWVLHRLFPIYAEACLWAGEHDEAAAVGARMRSLAARTNHKLGLAWADACDALVQWKRGDPRGGAVAMREAAESLEGIPMIPHAVRIRRQLAGRLAEIGDTDGSVEELRRVHDVFAKLGAEVELEKARRQFVEVGHRPPPRPSGNGMAGLTARELQISRLVARRMTNKGIGKELGIAERTVSTHLSNIFKKLEVKSRAQLGDLVRDRGLMED